MGGLRHLGDGGRVPLGRIARQLHLHLHAATELSGGWTHALRAWTQGIYVCVCVRMRVDMRACMHPP
jgi:hypothetical protein